MTKIVVLFAGLLTLAACNTGGTSDFSEFNSQTPVNQIAEPTDGVATDQF